MDGETKIKPGDTVWHEGAGEKWTVAAMSPDGSRLAWSGWPQGYVPTEECKLIESCSDEESEAMVQRCLKIRGGPPSYSDIRRRWSEQLVESRGTNGTTNGKG